MEDGLLVGLLMKDLNAMGKPTLILGIRDDNYEILLYWKELEGLTEYPQKVTIEKYDLLENSLEDMFKRIEEISNLLEKRVSNYEKSK